MTTFLCKKPFKKGMTLVEVVLSMALVALSIGGILGVLAQNTGLGKSLDYAYAAMNIAKGKIERLREVRRDKGYADLVNWQELTDVQIDRDGVSDPNGDFKRTTTVDPNYAANLTKVTVQVKYKRKGVFIPVQTEIVTLISPYY